MRKVLILWMVFLLTPGCTSLAAHLAMDSACERNNVYCGDNELEEKSTAKEVASKFIQYDKKVLKKIVEATQGENGIEEQIQHDDIPTCDNQSTKICSAVEGCYCSPKE